jgi:hypothetical protein
VGIVPPRRLFPVQVARKEPSGRSSNEHPGHGGILA